MVGPTLQSGAFAGQECPAYHFGKDTKRMEYYIR